MIGLRILRAIEIFSHLTVAALVEHNQNIPENHEIPAHHTVHTKHTDINRQSANINMQPNAVKSYFCDKKISMHGESEVEGCGDDEHINLETSTCIFNLKCEKCGNRIKYATIANYIRNVAINGENCKISEKMHKIASKLINKIASSLKFEFLVFSLNFSKSELKTFMEYCLNRNSNGAKMFLMKERIESIIENWDICCNTTTENIKKLKSAQRIAFLCKLGTELVPERIEYAEQYIWRLVDIYENTAPVLSTEKLFFYSKLVFILECQNEIVTNNISYLLYNLIDTADDVKNAAFNHIYKNVDRTCKDHHLLELTMINSIFNPGDEDDLIINEACEMYAFSETGPWIIKLVDFINKVTRLIYTKHESKREYSILEFSRVVEQIKQAYLSRQPNFLDILVLFELIRKNETLSYLLPEMKSYFIDVLQKTDISTALHEASKINAEKDHLYGYLFIVSWNKNQNHPVEILIDAINSSQDRVSKLLIPYGLIFRGVMTPYHHFDVVNRFKNFQNLYYCDYMRGLALYILRMINEKPLVDLLDYLCVYTNCFVSFKSNIDEFSSRESRKISESVLYGLNAYLCDVINKKYFYIGKMCKYKYINSDLSFSNVIYGIVRFMKYARDSWVRVYIENALICVLDIEIRKYYSNTRCYFRACRVANYATRFLLGIDVPLLEIHERYLGGYTIFVDHLIFNYFKEMCFVKYGVNPEQSYFLESTQIYIAERIKASEKTMKFISIFRDVILKDVHNFDQKSKFKKAILKFRDLFSTSHINLSFDLFNNALCNSLVVEIKVLLKAYMEWEMNVTMQTKGRKLNREPTEREYIIAFEALFPIEDVRNVSLMESSCNL